MDKSIHTYAAFLRNVFYIYLELKKKKKISKHTNKLVELE